VVKDGVIVMRVPRAFRLLALIGVLVGSWSALYALTHAGELLVTRDQFINSYRDADLAPVITGESPDARRARLEKVADALYSRRGVALPLAIADCLLSGLLFIGCFRALRLSVWGVQAWGFACTISIPYQILDGVRFALEAKDLSLLVQQPASALMVVGFTQAGVCIVYYVACVIYLRKSRLVRALFAEHAQKAGQD
jgi:hypothetical protein